MAPGVPCLTNLGLKAVRQNILLHTGVADRTQGHQGRQEDRRGVVRCNRGIGVGHRGREGALLGMLGLRRGMQGETRRGMTDEGSVHLPDTHQRNYTTALVECWDTRSN